MAYRLVRAVPLTDRLPDLRERLEGDDIAAMEPFGEAMTTGLQAARYDPETAEAVWVEKDFCTPPLAMERDVLEEYFESITVVDPDVDEAAGWARIDDLPSLWDRDAR